MQGSEAQQLGVMAQQVRAVLEQHGAGGLNLVKEGPQVRHSCGSSCSSKAAPALRERRHWSRLCVPAVPTRLWCLSPPSRSLQGLLSVDYGGLGTLTMLALKQVIQDVAQLREAHATLQLTAAGHLDGRAAAASLQGLQRSASGSSAGAASTPSAASATSVALLEAGRDEYMLESSGSEGEGSTAEGAAAATPPAGDLAGLSDDAAAQHLMQALGEPPSSKGMFKVRSACGRCMADASCKQLSL